MEKWQQMVIKEESQLADKLKKLADFIDGGPMEELDIIEREALINQSHYMTGYLRILNERITRFDL